MSNVNLTIDGISVEVPQGSTILDAARAANIHIPTLCFLKNVSDIASCRMCVVEVEGVQGLLPACSTLAEEGMQVTATSDELDATRRLTLDLILSSHGLNSTNFCFSCKKNGACELQDLGREFGMEELTFEAPAKTPPCSTAIRSSRSIRTCASRASGVSAHATRRRAITRCARASVAFAPPFRRRLAPIGKRPSARAAETAPRRAPRARSRKSAVAIIVSGKSRACAPRARIAALAASSTLL